MSPEVLIDLKKNKKTQAYRLCVSAFSPGEVESFCSNLSGRLHVNAAVRMSVDKLHDLLFSADTHFIQHLFSQRHFTGELTHTCMHAHE